MSDDSTQQQTSELTPKQRMFVDEYIKDLNATQAAIRAGYAQPHSQGPRLLENVGVKAAIASAQEARSKRTQVDADWMLKRLAAEADADLADLYDDAGRLKPVKQWPLIWRQGLVASVDTEEMRAPDSESEMITVRRLKLSDRVKRLELIGKHVNVQAFREQVEHKGAINLTVDQDDAKL